MRKKLLSIALLLASLTSFAQLEQGKFLVGGGIGVESSASKFKDGSTSVDRPKTTSYYITPSVGYFLAENFALGLTIGFGGDTRKTPASGGTPELKDKNPYFVVGPFGRYYRRFGDNFAIFGQAAIDFRFGKYKDESFNGSVVTTTETKTSVFNPNLRPGLVFFPYSKVGVELIIGELGYAHTVEKYPNDSKERYNNVDFNFNLRNVQLGIYLYL